MNVIDIINGITICLFLYLLRISLDNCWASAACQKNIPKKIWGGVVAENTEKVSVLHIVIFVLLIVFSIAIRVWQFGSVPGGMNQDEAMAAVEAKALAEHGTDRFGMYMPTHFTAWVYSQMNTLMSYCMVPLFKLFGFSGTIARIPVLLASIAGIVAMYFFIKQVFGIIAAELVTALLAINPWHYMQSRWALEANMFPHMAALGLAMLFLGIRKKKRYLYFSMVFFAMCMYSYGISFYTVPFFLLTLCILLLRQKLVNWKDAGISIGVYVLLSWPIYTTMAINAIGGENAHSIQTPFFTIPYFPYSVRSQDILFFAQDKLAQFKVNFEATCSVLLHGDSLPWNTIPGFGALYPCFLLFVPFGIYYGIERIRKETDRIRKIGSFSLFLFLGMGILAGFITASVNVNRINIIFYPLIAFAGLGVYFVYLNKKQFLYIVGVVYLMMSGLFLHNYYTFYADNITEVFWASLIKSIQDLENHSDCPKYCINADSVGLSEIMTLFSLGIDAEYYQGKMPQDGLYYTEKFSYDAPLPEQIAVPGDYAYVISSNDLSLFAEYDYHIEVHGNYCSVIPNARYQESAQD